LGSPKKKYNIANLKKKKYAADDYVINRQLLNLKNLDISVLLFPFNVVSGVSYITLHNLLLFLVEPQ